MEGIDREVLQGLRMQYATEEQMEEAAAFKPKQWLLEAVQNSELPSVSGFFKTARLWEAVQDLELPSVAGFFKTARFNSLEQKIAQVRLPLGLVEGRGLGVQALDTGLYVCYG